MITSTKIETEQRYRRLLAAQAGSGLSLRAFAAEQGIPAGTLSYWKHELKRRDAARAERQRNQGREPQFLAVKVVPATEPAPSAPGAYEVVLGRDFVLRLPRDFEVARVAALVKAVASC